jgi:ketol-acid reductoisomerase
LTVDDSPLRFFTAQNTNLQQLAGERLAVLGYGNLGRALALNLRDSLQQISLDGKSRLVIGNIDDGYATQARDDGFVVLPIDQAIASCDVALILLPDEVIPEVFEASIAPSLVAETAILFASGYTLAYELITPADDVDVLLLAPRMGGELARERFLNGKGFFAYVSVEQDASGKAWDRLLAVAGAAGVLQAGALELGAQLEADLDLLVEQTLGAAIGTAIMTIFTQGVEAGIPAEALVLEMYMSGEMETVFQGFREMGFFHTSDFHGPTAMYGGFVRSMELMTSDIPARFRQTLDEIRSGQFARQFQAEREAGYPTLSQAQAMAAEEGPIAEPIAQAEARVRAMLGISRAHPGRTEQEAPSSKREERGGP